MFSVTLQEAIKSRAARMTNTLVGVLDHFTTRGSFARAFRLTWRPESFLEQLVKVGCGSSVSVHNLSVASTSFGPDFRRSSFPHCLHKSADRFSSFDVRIRHGPRAKGCAERFSQRAGNDAAYPHLPAARLGSRCLRLATNSKFLTCSLSPTFQSPPYAKVSPFTTLNYFAFGPNDTLFD